MLMRHVGCSRRLLGTTKLDLLAILGLGPYDFDGDGHASKPIRLKTTDATAAAGARSTTTDAPARAWTSGREPAHPRLRLSDAAVANARGSAASDPTAAELLHNISAHADAILRSPLPNGTALLCDPIRDHMYTLATRLANHRTSNSKQTNNT